MGKCYICEIEVEEEVFYIGRQEIILCVNNCWAALGDAFRGNPFSDYYKTTKTIFSPFKKVLTEEGLEYIKKNKTKIKNFKKNKEDRIEDIAQRIIALLKEKSKKISISDIAAFLKEDRKEVKSLLEYLHSENHIDFAGNGRYFILSEEKKKPKKATAKVEKVDIEKELEKYKGLLDKGLIEKEDFDAKKKELLGL